jgi:hypothetical protein
MARTKDNTLTSIVSESLKKSFDIDAFKNQANLTRLLYAGTLELEHYKRFMLIGYR